MLLELEQLESMYKMGEITQQQYQNALNSYPGEDVKGYD